MDQERAYLAAATACETAWNAIEEWRAIVQEGAVRRRGPAPVDYVQDPAYAAVVRIHRHQQRAMVTLRRYRRAFSEVQLPD